VKRSLPLSWWLFAAGFFWLAIPRWDLNWLEVLGLAFVAGAVSLVVDSAWAEIAKGAAEGWNRDKEEENDE
jgi:hypothetical protein